LLAVLLCLLYGAAAALSWVKSDLTTNDFERFDDLRLTVAYFLVFLALSAIYLERVGRPGAAPRATIEIQFLNFTRSSEYNHSQNETGNEMV
jgi:hypothetical protein